jgi:hypothetical protein
MRQDRERTRLAAGAIVSAARDVGGAIVAGRARAALDAVYGDDPTITTEAVDLTVKAPIAALAERLSAIAHRVHRIGPCPPQTRRVGRRCDQTLL